MDTEDAALTPTLGGQIVRVYMENFMTYDAMEIHPGFHLNMIIGPNGTGKSTIVCAVLLGLGGKLKTLGRADQIGSYVKSGCEQSVIEIELYVPRQDNIVIRRQISAANHSQFYVNGKNASAAMVNEIRARFNIQVDNLCTFLPQEKVQDFAKMNPQQTLEHTEKTIGNGELLEKHENLKSLRSDLMANESVKQGLEDQLQTEIAKNERLSVRVQAIREKQSLCDRVNLLNQKKHWLLYHNALNEKKAVEKDVKLAATNKDKKTEEVEKFQRELTAIEENSKAQQEAVVVSKREEAGKRAVMEDRLQRVQQRLDRFADLDGNFQAKLAEEEEKKKRLGQSKATVDKLTNDLRALDSSSDANMGMKQEDHRLSVELKRRHEEEVQLTQKKMAAEEDIRGLQQELRNVAGEKRLLENRRSLRLDYLKRNEPDVYKSVQWLEQNQDKFHGKVYNPMLLELNVTDPKMARQIEATIPYQDLLAFTVTYGDDLNTLVQNLRVQMKLRINIVTAEDNKGTQYHPNVPISQLRLYGFHSYVKDYIRGPDPIVQYLCRSHKVHNIPIGDSTVQNKSDKIPITIRKYFSDEYVFDVRVSTYSAAKSTTVRKLGDPRFFTESVDVNKLAALERKTIELSQKVDQSHAVVQEVTKLHHRLREAMDEVRRRKREIALKLEERDRVVAELERARADVERTKQTIRNPSELRKELSSEKTALENNLERMLSELQKAHQALEVAYLKRCRSSLLLKASRIGIEDVQNRQVQAKEALRTALDALRLVEDRYRSVEAACSRAKNAARQLTDNQCPGDRGFRALQEQFAQLKDTVAELEAELEETQARADFLDGGSAQVLTEYNRREEEIARLREESEVAAKKIETKLALIERNRVEWLTPIHELISTVDHSFGAHFESMGCVGEVCLLVPEDQNDFDGYGIKIRVKFRDGVPLQDLGRYFQSGGERAVSTAIYMLSLQNLTSVPFRFVDEINQGMDPTNERRITDLIIRVTTPRESSQYFFITPKLMPDFDCPETMATLCVYNGPNAIPVSEWDVDKFLLRALGQAEQEAASNS